MPNPYEPPKTETLETPPSESNKLGGVNVDPKDNMFQLAGIFIGLFLGAAIGGYIYSTTQVSLSGVMIGGFLGVFTGLLVTGALLMNSRHNARSIRSRSNDLEN